MDGEFNLDLLAYNKRLWIFFQARTPRVTAGGQQSLGDQGGGRGFYASAENLETMGDADPALGFNRSNRLRQSLPLARSPSQNKLRPPGIITRIHPFICS